MKISTKGRYALRLMLDLALEGRDKYVSVKDISKRQDISEKYLEQIMASLSRHGLVESARGASGGYKVAVPLNECTVGMILRATEGSLKPVNCIENGCERREGCAACGVWEKLEGAINEVVNGITLASLTEKYEAKA